MNCDKYTLLLQFKIFKKKRRYYLCLAFNLCLVNCQKLFTRHCLNLLAYWVPKRNFILKCQVVIYRKYQNNNLYLFINMSFLWFSFQNNGRSKTYIKQQQKNGEEMKETNLILPHGCIKCWNPDRRKHIYVHCITYCLLFTKVYVSCIISTFVV